MNITIWKVKGTACSDSGGGEFVRVYLTDSPLKLPVIPFDVDHKYQWAWFDSVTMVKTITVTNDGGEAVPWEDEELVDLFRKALLRDGGR